MSLNRFILVLLIFTNCATDKTMQNKDVEKVQKISKEIEIGYLNLKLIGQLEKKFQKGVKMEDLNKIGCDDWLFHETYLSNIIKEMRKVESVEWNALCYVYPCFYSGKVSNGEVDYEIFINSASHIILQNEKEVLYFIHENQSGKFLIPCNCCEEER